MDDFLDFMILLLLAFSTLAILILAIVFLWAAIPARLGCNAFSEATHLHTDYRFWYGCFVTMPDGSIVTDDVAMKILGNKYQLKFKKDTH
ncbi:MAG: hypothetical protein ACYDB1_00700 [Acidiferrobacteraceae bacterium]